MLQFLISRWSRHYFLFILLTGLSQSLFGQTLFQNLENAFEKSTEFYPKFIQSKVDEKFNIKSVKDIKQIQVLPIFINMLAFHNQNNVLKLGLKDRCSLIDLLGTDLLYGPNGKLNYVLFHYYDKNNKQQVRVLKRKEYLKKVGYIQCPKSKKLSEYFSVRNLRQTLKNQRFKMPSSLIECKNSFNEFLESASSPYICNIINSLNELPVKLTSFKNLTRANYRNHRALKKQIDTAKSYQKIINKNSVKYFNYLCENADNAQNYCSELFQVNYWTHLKNKTQKGEALNYYCNKLSFKNGQTDKCIRSLINNDTQCHYAGTKHGEIFPKTNCRSVSNLLNQSRLYKNYNDCPLKVNQDNLVTASRILSHISPPFENNQSLECEAYSTFPYAQFNSEFLENQAWDLKVCYDDQINRKKVCYPTMLQDVKGSDFSLSANIGKILAKLRGFQNKSNQCKIIPKGEYKPNFLEFKTGCYIVKDQEKCFGVNCPFKVIYDDREFKKYTVESDLWLDLIPFKRTEEGRSLIKLIERHHKKKIKEVKNISTFLKYFSKSKKTIFMGIGCLEDLLPSYEQSKSLNSCQINSFIVDGFIEENKRYSMITRTSMDQIQAPRLIPWTNIFNSIRNYQTLHPLNQWSFYAIY